MDKEDFSKSYEERQELLARIAFEVGKDPDFMKDVIDAILDGMKRRVERAETHAMLAEKAAVFTLAMLKPNKLTPSMRDSAEKAFEELGKHGSVFNLSKDRLRR